MKLGYVLCAAAIALSACCGQPKEVYTQLDFGSVKPAGWLRHQMEHDMEGFAGNLDLIVPDLVDDPIYSTGRLHGDSKVKDLGNLKEGDVGGDDQYKWWNSETQSNWWDGYIRNALLLDNKEYLERAAGQIMAMLATQDEDGYLGIYTPATRYGFTSENGEFWAKVTLYRYLLAYYEATGDTKVWDALLRALDNTMEGYPVDASEPFEAGESYSGGMAHGLVFTDVLDRLQQLTGDERYGRYALFMYRNYSDHFMYEKDAQLSNVLDPEYKFLCHGVHTYEHLRPIIVAEYASPELREVGLIDKYLDKVRYATTATGGAIGDEWVGGRGADPTMTGYEFCSLHELMDSYSVLMQKRGDRGLGNVIENIFYNAGLGARHPEKSCIAYLKTDNSYEMTGTKNGASEAHTQTRYKYSAAHQDAAVCCVPNAGRMPSYFLQRAWMKQGERTLVANILMPNILKTYIGGNTITIENKTDYPWSNDMTLVIAVDKPTGAVIKVRKPDWTTDVACSAPYSTEGEYLVFDKKFAGTQQIGISFKTDIRVIESPNGEHHFAYGPLIYARPIAAIETEGRRYTENFVDLLYRPTDDNRYEYIADHGATYADNRIGLKLKNRVTGDVEQVELVPLARTILRQAAF